MSILSHFLKGRKDRAAECRGLEFHWSKVEVFRLFQKNEASGQG